MPGLTLFEGSIAAETTLGLVVKREFDTDLPIILAIDGDVLRLTVDEAAKLANAGRRIEKAFKVEAPKAGSVFRHKIAFESGDIAVFELGVADPIGVYLERVGASPAARARCSDRMSASEEWSRFD